MKRAIVCFASAVLFASCSAALETSPSTATPAQGAARAAAGSGQQRLYVAECCGVLNTGDVARYGPDYERVSQRYINGAHFPLQIAIDDSGTQYVLNESNLGPQGIAITEYDRGSPKRSRRIGYFYWATAFALDPEAKVYVANFGRDGRLYVANWPPNRTGWISVYSPGGSSPIYEIKESISYPVSMALDGSDNLYVANLGDYGDSWISVYEPSGGAFDRDDPRGQARAAPLACVWDAIALRQDQGNAGDAGDTSVASSVRERTPSFR